MFEYGRERNVWMEKLKVIIHLFANGINQINHRQKVVYPLGLEFMKYTRWCPDKKNVGRFANCGVKKFLQYNVFFFQIVFTLQTIRRGVLFIMGGD